MEKNTSADFGPRCFVTGSAGFLGRALIESLVDLGCEVNALDLRPAAFKDGRVKQFTGDIRDYDTVRNAAEGCHTAFHCASVMNFLGLCRKKVRDEVHGINVTGTMNVIRACREAGLKSLVYTSSHCVCYDPKPVIDGDESKPYAAKYLDLYGETKAEAEMLVLAANSQDGLHTTALRPGGLWGPDEGCYMLSKLVEQALKGRLVAKIGRPDAIIDNTHIRNMVEAEIKAAEGLAKNPGLVGGQAYFITDEEPMNLMEWFRPLIEGIGYRVPERAIPARLMSLLAFLAECLHFAGGPRPFMTRLEVHNVSAKFTFKTDKARSDLGYRPTVGMASGMDECVEFFKRR